MKHKDYYNDDYVLDISQRIHSVMPEFQERAFSHALIGSLEDKELFARFDCIVDAMEKNMTEDYSKNIEAFFHMLGPELAQSQGGNGRVDKMDKRRKCSCSILTNLKDDPEKFVQKSVGNNLNDLYKEAPEKADFIITQWKKVPQSKASEWIIKHGTRNQ